MSIAEKTYTFPSTTGTCEIFARSWAPEAPKGVVQIAHGMAEHGLRYEAFGRFLAENGYVCVIADHAGHGKSVQDAQNKGYFGQKDGWKHLADDQAALCDLVKMDYPGLPYAIFGHSMGSFIVRRFTAVYGDQVNAAVYCGTCGNNPAVGAGILAASLTKTVRGEKHPSKLIDQLAFGAYNKKFSGRTKFDWLTRDDAVVDQYIADEDCGFLFTAAGYGDLLRLIRDVNSKDWYDRVPKDLPLFLIAGDMDPVGAYGKGVTQVCNDLKAKGCNAKIKLYPEARHEILNELNKEEVYADVLEFLNEAL